MKYVAALVAAMWLLIDVALLRCPIVIGLVMP
jgi:hypothetical protein